MSDIVSVISALEDTYNKTIAVAKWFAGLLYLLALLCYTAGREYGPQLNRNFARVCGKVYGYGRLAGKKYFPVLSMMDYETRTFITKQFGTEYDKLRQIVSPVHFVRVGE